MKYFLNFLKILNLAMTKLLYIDIYIYNLYISMYTYIMYIMQ